jgi:hypothetical protein
MEPGRLKGNGPTRRFIRPCSAAARPEGRDRAQCGVGARPRGRLGVPGAAGRRDWGPKLTGSAVERSAHCSVDAAT